VAYLSDKIINGGGGVWGEVAMSAHPQLTIEDASKIVAFILALAQEDKAGLETEGEYMVDKETKPGSSLVLRASYADNGNGETPSILSEEVLILKSPQMDGKSVSDGKNYETMVFGSRTILLAENEAFMEIPDIDLTGVGSIKISGTLIGANTHCDLKVEIDGQEVGVGSFKKLGPGTRPETFLSEADVETYQEKRGTLVLKIKSNTESGPAMAITSIEFKKK
jgi:hypothetical protein